ncbi:MAG TPA: GDSL-type esterase/lipase family protein [Acidimicrobiales bacterium]|nr:GDSL-type esterase/lipase family protein [Acidimicrobiales bacterium]
MRSVRRWAGGLLPGAAARRLQVVEFAAAWRESNEAALSTVGPLWVALGDSTGQGIGASAWNRGYVGQLLERLRRERDPTWTVVNLSRSGARVADVLDEQVPALGTTPRVRLVTCAVGANDLLRADERRVRADLARLVTELPGGAVLATLPQGIRPARAAAHNAFIVERASALALVVADVWAYTAPPWRGKVSADHFHPNDYGYADWTAAFADAVGLGGTT